LAQLGVIPMQNSSASRRSGRPRKGKQHADLWGYFALSCSVCGGASYIHDLWNEPSTFDFGLVLFVEVGMASAWIRLTNGILTEIEWNKFMFFPFLSPVAVLIFVEVMHPNADAKALALLQVAFAVVLALLAAGVRKEMAASLDKGGSS